ncbi:12479_t:CDS:2, partial [Entrophospora sp. SA101]
TTRLQSMAQIHSFYITNAKTELNYPNSDLTDDELDTTIQEITAAMAEDDDSFEYSEDNDLFEYGEEEEGEDQNEEEDESLGLNNDILFMEDIMNLSLGFDENRNEDESTTRNEQEIFDHGNRNDNSFNSFAFNDAEILHKTCKIDPLASGVSSATTNVQTNP